MLYLLDANVLITANNSYYPVDRVPEYWEWLQHMGTAGRVKIPIEILEEIKDGPKDGERDLLYAWLQEEQNVNALVLEESVDEGAVQHVVEVGYAPDLTDSEIEYIGRDPFLIAYALVRSDERCVVTVEASKPKMQRQNRRVPDVCRSVGVTQCDPFAMNRDLTFRTNWKNG